MNNLREIIRHPSFLEKAGFIEREKDTTDAVRWVWFEKTIESDVTLVLQVEFELSISDNPFVKTRDNFYYHFNGVYLRIVEGDSNSSDNQSGDEEVFANLQFPPVLMEEPREIDRINLNVSTWAQLRSLCKILGFKD